MNRLLRGNLKKIITIRQLSSNTNGSTGLSYYHYPGHTPLEYRTVGQQLELSAKKYSTREALTSQHENRTITFSEALHEADKFAAGLANLGLKRGDRIGLWMPNKLNWYISFLGIARLGGVSVLLNSAYQIPEIEYCIKKVGIKAMITTETFKTQNYYKMLGELFPELQSGNTKIERKGYSLERIIVDSDNRLRGTLTFEDVTKVSDTDVAEISKLQELIQPDDGFNIQFTSGTTGLPKAALLGHSSCLNNCALVGTRLEFDKMHHKVCQNGPFFHTLGSNVGILSCMIHGASLYIPSPSFSADECVKCIQKYKCTYVYGTPTMYVDIIAVLKKLKIRLESLQYAVTGGAPVSPRLLNNMYEYLGLQSVRSLYGMTETSPTIFQSMPQECKEKVLSSVGKVLDHLEVKVVDANGDLVPYGTPGEIWTRGFGNMLGYYGDPQKTQETITPDRWLRTGDQFVLYEDGYGQIVGRLKEMLIRGGENIFPKKIEDFLNSHPDIMESYIVGVPDERLGEEVAAFIKMAPGKQDLTLDDIRMFSKGKLAHFKIPQYVRTMTEFPKTLSGKIQKFKLIEQFTK